MSKSVNYLSKINKNRYKKISNNRYKNQNIVDQIRELRPVPNPWRVGEVAKIVIKGNPELKGRSGQWCIIEEVLNFSCLVRTWDGVIQVKIENLKDFYYSSQQQKEMKIISDRLSQIPHKNLEESIKQFLEGLGKIERPFLTNKEEKILNLLESET
ncbi:MAG: hypothetical protein QNJ64_18675 [Crocosphaera sp.]|nr:hypothetical protein [Crocosphaera sp.]